MNRLGSRFYFAGSSGNRVFQYNLTQPNSLQPGSPVFFGSYVIPPSTTIQQQGLGFSEDESLFYLVGSSKKTIYEFSVVTPGDITTAAPTGASLNISVEAPIPQGIRVHPTKRWLYVVDSWFKRVLQYELAIPGDLTSVLPGFTFLDVSAKGAFPQSVSFSSDGSYLLLAEDTTDTIYEYRLPRRWQVNSGTDTGRSFPVGAQDGGTQGVTLASNNRTFIVTGIINKVFSQYSVPGALGNSLSLFGGDTFVENGSVGQLPRSRGYMRRFDGNSANYLRSPGGSVSRNAPLTVCCVIKPEAIASQSPFTQYASTADGFWIINMTTGGSREVALLVITNAATFAGIGITTLYNPGDVYIVLGWVEEISPGVYQARLRINGGAMAAGSTYSLPLGTATPNILVGRRDGGDPRPYTGGVAEWAVWNDAFSVAKQDELFTKLGGRPHLFHEYLRDQARLGIVPVDYSLNTVGRRPYL
jgi:hypothetical protein